MSDIPAKIKQLVHEELRGLYTVSLCIVEEFDPKNMLVKVSLKRDKKAIMRVPVASTFAQSDGYGQVPPIASGDEGALLHTKAPIDELTVEEGHQDYDLGNVVFDINDALFLPRYWNDNDAKPVDIYSAFKKGDYLLAHGAGTSIHIKGDEHTDPGTATIDTGNGMSLTFDMATSSEKIELEDSNGQTITMDDANNETVVNHPSGQKLTVKDGEIVIDGTVTLGTGTAKELLNKDAVFEYEDTQPDGSTTTKTTSTVSNNETTTDTTGS